MKPSGKKDAAEFAAYVRGDHPHDDDYRQYVLAELRCAMLRMKLKINEIVSIGTALRGKAVDPDTAIEMLWAADALEFLLPLGEGLGSEGPCDMAGALEFLG